MEKSNLQYVLNLRSRGRPRSASEELRANNYKNEKGRYQVSGLSYWHTRVVDHMILNPDQNIKQLAEAFEVTPQWMGQLTKADAFVAYYNSRIAAHQEYVSTKIVAKTQGIAEKALDILSNKLEEDLSFGQVKDAADLSLKVLGYSQGTQVNVAIDARKQTSNTMIASAGALNEARERIAQRQKENGKKYVHDKDNYKHVTSSLGTGPEKSNSSNTFEGIEDAITLPREE